jgi:hypothetical protein
VRRREKIRFQQKKSQKTTFEEHHIPIKVRIPVTILSFFFSSLTRDGSMRYSSMLRFSCALLASGGALNSVRRWEQDHKTAKTVTYFAHGLKRVVDASHLMLK